MNPKPILHISFADDALAQAGGEVIFDDSALVAQAVCNRSANLQIQLLRIYDLCSITFPEVTEYSAIIIGGSGHFVREAEELLWMNDMILFIRRATEANVPLLGICFGHQIIAHALGGVVGPFRDGHRDFGVVSMEKVKNDEDHVLFQHVPDVFNALASHQDHVHELPVGARVLARSSGCNVEAAEFAPMIYGVQFHPEYTTDTMLYLARERIVDEASRDRFSAGLSNTPHAKQVLENFVRYAVTR